MKPQGSKDRRACAAEGAILGILVLDPEMIPKVSAAFENAVALAPEDFLTDFHREVYTALITLWRNCGSCDIGFLHDQFSQDQISRITQLSVKRAKLQNNTIAVLQDNVRVLREEADRLRLETEQEIQLTDLKALLQKKRKKQE